MHEEIASSDEEQEKTKAQTGPTEGSKNKGQLQRKKNQIEEKQFIDLIPAIFFLLQTI